MSKTVWKFPLVPGHNVITAPASRVVYVGVDPVGAQDGPTVWVECSPDLADDDPGSFTVAAFGTGHDIPDAWSHLGSVVTPVGLVWHVYLEPRS